MNWIIMITVGTALLLFASVPLAHLILEADKRHLRKSEMRAERREDRLEEKRLQAEVERTAEEAEARRQMEEAIQVAVWAEHRPVTDSNGDRWGFTVSAPPPWKM
jgi:hypothetical protein